MRETISFSRLIESTKLFPTVSRAVKAAFSGDAAAKSEEVAGILATEIKRDLDAVETKKLALAGNWLKYETVEMENPTFVCVPTTGFVFEMVHPSYYSGSGYRPSVASRRV